MLHWNELRITPDNKYLIIEVAVDNDSYFNDITIDSIVIDTNDTYSSSGPSSNPIYTYKAGNVKKLRLVITNNDLLDKNIQPIDLSKNLFFVYATATGTPDPSTPCGLDNSILLGTVVNLFPFYLVSMKYLSELDNLCLIPKNFIDMILKFKGLLLSIKMKNYTQAIKYWNKFFSKLEYKPTLNCNCNG